MMKTKTKAEAAPAQVAQPATSARWCPLCGTMHAVHKGSPSPWPHITRPQIEALPELLQALQEVERVLQAAYLHGQINVNSQDHCSIATARDQARAALAKAQGDQP